jgi:hypothetical protein
MAKPSSPYQYPITGFKSCQSILAGRIVEHCGRDRPNQADRQQDNCFSISPISPIGCETFAQPLTPFRILLRGGILQPEYSP